MYGRCRAAPDSGHTYPTSPDTTTVAELRRSSYEKLDHPQFWVAKNFEYNKTPRLGFYRLQSELVLTEVRESKISFD
jgi:hypothetical protein